MSLPEGADKLQTWCLARWKEKERLLEHLQEKGAFPVGKGQAVIEVCRLTAARTSLRRSCALATDYLAPSAAPSQTPPPPVGGQIITACGFVAVSLFYGWLLFVSSWVRWCVSRARAASDNHQHTSIVFRFRRHALFF